MNHVEEEKFHSFPPDFYLEYWWNSSLIPLHEKIFSVRILFQKNNFHFHPFILRKLKEKRFPLNRNDDSINFLYHFSFSSMSVDQTPNRLWIYALLDHFLLHSNNHPERVLNVIQQQIQEIHQQFKIPYRIGFSFFCFKSSLFVLPQSTNFQLNEHRIIKYSIIDAVSLNPPKKKNSMSKAMMSLFVHFPIIYSPTFSPRAVSPRLNTEHPQPRLFRTPQNLPFIISVNNFWFSGNSSSVSGVASPKSSQRTTAAEV